MEINPERRRISLSMKAAAADLGFEIEVDESIQVEEKPAKKKAEKADAPAEEAAAPELPNSLSVHNAYMRRPVARPAFFCYWSRRRKCRLFSERRRFYAR